MARVICTLPNASEEISGIKFTPHEQGMQSEDITLEQAAAFTEIRGYQLVDADGRTQAQAQADAEAQAAQEQSAERARADAQAKADAQAAAQRQAAEDDARELAEITALADEAKSLGIEVKGNWKAPRLKAEIKRATEEKAAAADAAAAAGAADQGKTD